MSQQMKALNNAATKHNEARSRLSDARADLDAQIKQAAANGVSESELARATGLSRVTVRRILGKKYSRSVWPKPKSDQ